MFINFSSDFLKTEAEHISKREEWSRELSEYSLINILSVSVVSTKGFTIYFKTHLIKI